MIVYFLLFILNSNLLLSAIIDLNIDKSQMI